MIDRAAIALAVLICLKDDTKVKAPTLTGILGNLGYETCL